MRYFILLLLASPLLCGSMARASSFVTIANGGEYVVTGPFVGPNDPVIELNVSGSVSGGTYDGPLPPPPPTDDGINAYGAKAILTVNGMAVYANCYYTQIASMCGRSLPAVRNSFNASQGFQEFDFSSDLETFGQVSPLEATFFVVVPDGYSLVPFAQAVPESSMWVMLLIGFAGIGSAGYRRRRTGAFGADGHYGAQETRERLFPPLP
jgi:hypothetical protein